MRRSETPLRAISGFVHLQQDRCVNPLQIALSTSFRFGEHQYLPVSGLEAAFAAWNRLCTSALRAPSPNR